MDQVARIQLFYPLMFTENLLNGTALNYYWSPPSYIDDINAIKPEAFPPQDIIYTLTATSTVGCGSSSDDVNVKVYQGFFIPNSFTPNGDGKNDKFRILPYDNYLIQKFVIYNRWGGVIFQTKTADEGWDGTYQSLPQPTGSYVYFVELLDPNGKKIIKKGIITLIR
jgi:gliding motility-associated-like protein